MCVHQNQNQLEQGRAVRLIQFSVAPEHSNCITHLGHNSRYPRMHPPSFHSSFKTGTELAGCATLLRTAPYKTLATSPEVLVIPMPKDPTAYARSLYATLHALDQRGLDRLIVDDVPPGPEWAAIRDRLKRAAT